MELVIETSFVKVMQELGDAERGRLFTAMCEYAETGETQEFRGNERYVFPAAKMMIDKQLENTHEHSSDFGKHTCVSNAHTNAHQNAQNHTYSKYTYSDRFEFFWKLYPKERQIDKQRAYKAWCKYSVDDALAKEIYTGLEYWKNSEQWKDPQFIPHPATWLNNKRWEVRPPVAKQKNKALAYSQKPISEQDFDALVVDLGGDAK